MKNQAEEYLLVMAAQKGNHDAFRVLFQHHQPGLIRFAYKLSNDQEVAKDASQDVWIKTAKTLYKLNDPKAFKSWIYRAVRWRTLDLIRQKQRQNNMFEHGVEQQELENNTVNTSQPDSVETDKSALIAAIDTLARIERQMIHLFYLDDMAVAEISIVLDIPVGTVKSRLNRARQQLKQKLENDEDEYR
ncbi:RNA polymerase sigma factor [Paraglaciecola sp. L3A3]|uniref:RNA polymerase sigma factor n=1 Tax=Paraglaciecola sp. L3A3 TaxID=2686358 RepID=UPI00131A6CAE|nr:sigma-70 family RNA polymerase sigma factor [Paraglaciecola sp. L3A3]